VTKVNTVIVMKVVTQNYQYLMFTTTRWMKLILLLLSYNIIELYYHCLTW